MCESTLSVVIRVGLVVVSLAVLLLWVGYPGCGTNSPRLPAPKPPKGWKAPGERK